MVENHAHANRRRSQSIPDVKRKGVASADNHGMAQAPQIVHAEVYTSASHANPRRMSMSYPSDDGQDNTLLSVSSLANTDTLSSSAISDHSTAMTGATTDDDALNAPEPAASPYAQPNITLLELISNTVSSSALSDSFDVNVSRKGGYIAIYCTSHIWLVKTAQLPRLWARTLQMKRKPVAVDITDDGSLLAVLSRPAQVDIYEIHGEGDEQVKKRKTITLVHEATSVVISPDMRILITGNQFGIEVMATRKDAPDTARRTLLGPAGDALEFSDDGRTLLITGFARKSNGSALFVLPGLWDGPLTEDGEPIPQAPEVVWTGSVLFPESARVARQATILRDVDTGTCNELFAFNAEDDSWGIYDIGCQRFTQRKMFLPDHQRWTRSEFVDNAMPAISPSTDLAAVALRMRGTTNIWIYHVPGWDNVSSEKQQQAAIQPCHCITLPKKDTDSLQEICILRWTRLNKNVQRLVAVGNTSMLANGNDVPGAPLGSKGVIIVLDFDKSKPGDLSLPTPVRKEYDLDSLCPGEMLPEGTIDFDREVELVRTRTQVTRRAEDRVPVRQNSRSGATALECNRTSTHPNPRRVSIASAESEELTAEEAQAAFEAPYHNQQPRSQMSLARAAIVAAVSPANRRHLRALPFRPLEYRRADGQRELPHESDADNWVQPPPVYTKTAAAAGSVSLSHPIAPPIPRLPSEESTSSPCPPTMSATVNPLLLSPSPPVALPNGPYQLRQLSHSSDNLPTVQRPPVERRPSLVHPSTFPNPRTSLSLHHRSSGARLPPPQLSPVSAGSGTHHSPLSHLNAAFWRPALRSRPEIESSIGVRPHPITIPNSLRRDCTPNVPMAESHHPAIPLFGSPTMNRMTSPHQPQPQQPVNSSPPGLRRVALPRTVPSEPVSATTARSPLGAPIPSYIVPHTPTRIDSLGMNSLSSQTHPPARAQYQQQPSNTQSRANVPMSVAHSPVQYSQRYDALGESSVTSNAAPAPSGRTSRLDFLSGGRQSRMGSSNRIGGRDLVETPISDRKRGPRKKRISCVVM